MMTEIYKPFIAIHVSMQYVYKLQLMCKSHPNFEGEQLAKNITT